MWLISLIRFDPYPEKKGQSRHKSTKVIHSLLLSSFLLFENHSVRQYKSGIAMSGLEAEPNMAGVSLMYTVIFCVQLLLVMLVWLTDKNP